MSPWRVFSVIPAQARIQAIQLIATYELRANRYDLPLETFTP